ncbi:MarR family transcriptional regulator [Lactobacillus selangorensis]|uniref:MarR family transcriptional regulator n=1 Tax=Lactobacillus selangorensis TaxID=81857 RepID=A0A0R2FX65_9LACO|nr:MarR family winged helix-turn-helix transcriptional regulator [Lactobacillus selangorensis]KRN28645.1 MarR family transcriptional regulator [Lactobacillus selangorensis]KRN32945.1 MarR family transcriptional regulator [Lactobacillus selangorensis]
MREPIGPRIKAVNTLFEKQLEKNLNHPNVSPHLTSAQFGLISYLYDHPHQAVYQRDLEKIFSLSRPTINGIVKRLRLGGFVDVSPSQSDKRYKLVTLTPASRAEMTKHRPDFIHDVRKIEDKMTAGMSDAEIAEMSRLIDKMLVNLKK